MNKQELTNIIRNIVREEVERALPNVLVEILASKVAEGQEVVTERRVAPLPARRPAAVPPRKFSSNPILNQVLNETQGGIPSDPEVQMVQAEMPVPGQQVSVLDAMKSIPKAQLNENKEVAGVLNVLKKDFRQVVKAMDKAAPRIPPPNFKMNIGVPGTFDQQD
jgi:hypothetical protein